ncbi:tyrosine-type recombinase/integrase [Streptomyces libani]|uniref:tyrosine-type recombinase/integrase n=1 Tax=Streptomyces nigrescens TaxID=1920 RepID=UPI0037F8CBD6
MDAGDCAASSGRDQPSASSSRRTWPGVRASSGRSLRAEPGRHRFHVLRHTYASMMLEAGESVVTVARWLGYSSPAVTLGYYAHFMPGSRKPEAGSKGRTAVDGLLARKGDPPCRWKLPRFSPGLIAADSPT